MQRIANDAGVNVSLISHHFGGKKALYRACLRRFGDERVAALERHLAPPRDLSAFRARVELLVLELLEWHLGEADVVAILLRDANDPDLWGPELEQQVFAFTSKLAGWFEQAKQAGLLAENADPLAASAVIYLSFSSLLQMRGHIGRVTGIDLESPVIRKELVERVVGTVFDGIAPRSNA